MSVTTNFLMLLSAAEDLDVVLPKINGFTLDEYGTSPAFTSVAHEPYGGDKYFDHHILICAHSNLPEGTWERLRDHVLTQGHLRFPNSLLLLLSIDGDQFKAAIGSIGRADDLPRREH